VNAKVQSFVLAMPALLRFVLVILAADAVEYASHRAYHEVPWLWRIHAIHHSPQTMDWLSDRGCISWNRCDALAGAGADLPAGVPAGYDLCVFDFISVQSVLIHSNIKVNLGWLRYVIVTTQFHHWHHASDAEAIDKNYAAHTPIFDLLFGTWHCRRTAGR